MKRCLLIALSLFMFCKFAYAENYPIIMAKTIHEITVGDMYKVKKNNIESINKMLGIMETSFFKEMLPFYAKIIGDSSYNATEGAYCVLDTKPEEISKLVMSEYEKGKISYSDKYLTMGSVLVFEKCGVTRQVHRRDIYYLFYEAIQKGVLKGMSPDYESDVRLKTEYYGY